MAPLSVCPTTCGGFSGSNILGSHCQKILNLKGLFISISGGVYCMIYGQKERGLPKFGEISRNPWKNEVGVRDKGERHWDKGNTVIYYSAPSSSYKDLSVMEKLVALSSSIGMLKGLVKLDVSWCPKLKNLPEEIGDLENSEELDASYTRISQLPSSIIRLNKVNSLSFTGQRLEDGVYFVFSQVNEGLHSLEILNLSLCNLIDGGLPEDIGCLSSLKELHLNGNNFVHLLEIIAQLGDLETMYLSNCKRLPQLPEFSKQLHTISVDWRNDLICNSLFQNISTGSESLSLRALMSWGDQHTRLVPPLGN
ncbi:hypothetical protein KY290_027313 [Solanum tuberosum]|uniref:Uncharacterized protein n=1 Tax=Solanum tuberosum TaxID=4113 RepID=A0ABQ7UEM1_SOLTU|nr:hypothetical protein KY290_027313 [Solanum tuberosum]